MSLLLLLGRVLAPPIASPTRGDVAYVDVAQKAGLTAANVFGGAQAKRYLLETTGCGVAFVDYDRDGHLDLFFVNGTTIEGFARGREPTHHLYRNNGDGTFTDVTMKAGVGGSGWGQGVCVADYDNDGWDDLFVTRYGKNQLYHNTGKGTFEEVAEKAGVAGEDKRWNTGCAFLDYDRDGKLDLFVANYVDQGPDFRLLPLPGAGQFCQYKGIAMACGPRGLKSGRNFLYHNNGDGMFTDVSESAGIVLPDKHYALGVLTLDYDNDGWEDIYVAVDSAASILYHNNRDGTFTDAAFMTGVAYSADGEAQAGMGVAAGDYDGDGWLDIAKTNFSDDTPNLYRNNGDGTFSEVTFPAGLGFHTSYLGWGVGFADYDNDGWRDLFMANGHLSPEVDPFHIDTTYAQRKLLYRNVAAASGLRKFEDVSASSGPGVGLVSSSRGVAFGDFDNDGDVDIAVSNMNGPPFLLRNDGGNRNHWIEIETRGRESSRPSGSAQGGPSAFAQGGERESNRERWSNRNGIGTRVELRAGALKQMDEVRSGGSYLSQNDFRLHFGLGLQTRVDEITLRWPSGKVDRIAQVASDRLFVVEEGKGIVQTRSFRPADAPTRAVSR